ncbi:MAG: FAD-binding protein [Planctomycetota bacterium]
MATHKRRRVIVVGGGLAGLAATARIVEGGLPVDLFSLVPVKRSHSVCAQGGINACNEVARQQGYSEYEHFDETIYGGDFLQHQPPVYEMCHWAPKIVEDPLRARRAGSAPGGGRPRQQVRVLGVPPADRRRGGRAAALRGDRRPGPEDHAGPRLPGRRGGHRHRRLRRDLREVHQLGHVQRRRRQPLLPGRRLVRQRRVHPGPPHRDPGCRQATAHERVGTRRGRPGVGAPQGRRHA